MGEREASETPGIRPVIRRSTACMLVSSAAWLLLLGSRPASAIDNSSWEIRPTHPQSAAGPGHDYLIYNLTPGQVVHDSVSIHNLTHEQLTFRTYASDASNNPRDGSFALSAEDAAKVDVAAWVHVEPGPLVVPGGGRADVPFELSVPRDATPGDHSGGIVAADVGQTTQVRRGSAVITIVRALGVRVYARVAGPLRPGLAASAMKIRTSLPLLPHVTGEGRATVSLEVRNTGNVRQAPTLDTRFTDVFGRTVARLPPRQLPELLPGGHMAVAQTWVGVPALGRFTAHLDLMTTDVSITRESRLWSVPWIELGAVAAFLAAAVGLIRRRTHQPAGREPSHELGAPGGKGQSDVTPIADRPVDHDMSS